MTCVYIGCSTHNVPSWSNVAMRSAGGRNWGLPCVVVLCTNSTMAFLAAPSFHDGSGSLCAPTVTVTSSGAPMTMASSVRNGDSHRFITPSESRAAACLAAARVDLTGSLGDGRSGRFDLGLHGVEVEARPLLHRRILDRRRCELQDLFLHEHEAPELVLEPLEVRLRADLCPAVGPARALERIETQVRDRRHVQLGLLAEPAAGLIDEPELVVTDAH